MDKKIKKPPMLKGWKLTDQEKEEYIKNNKLGMIYAGTGTACDLGCIYCQARSGSSRPEELTFEERLNVLNQAKELGCKLVHIAGAGEPTIDRYFWDQISYINKLEMIPVVFTNGMHITPKNAKRLYDLNASIIIKVHSRKSDLQDFFANRRGYTELRDKAISNLIEQGFNKLDEMRLGCDVLVTKLNIDEIPEIFVWARKNNIFPEIKPILFQEKASNQVIRKLLEVTGNEIRKLYTKLAAIDRSRFGYQWIPTPPYAGMTCDYYYYHLSIHYQGNVKPCIGFDTILGNIRTHSLKECWEHPLMDKIRNIKKNLKGKCGECPLDCYGCPCRRIIRQGEINLFNTRDCFADNI